MSGMHDPRSLYERDPAVPVPSGLPLVIALSGYVDAGEAVAQTVQHLLGTLENERVATFDPDELLDFRARRPIVTINDEQHMEWQQPTVTLDLVSDELGNPFLLLSGVEPDYRWRAFGEAVVALVEDLEVASTTVVVSIPIPLPHTRPIRFSVWGNRPELVREFSAWVPTSQNAAGAVHVPLMHLYDRGHPTTAFVVLVPHYLSDGEYAAAALAAIEGITAATGRIFPTESIREQDRAMVARVNEQIAKNAEIRQLVRTLEERYDEFAETNGLHSPLTDNAGEVPSAEALAAEMERFLAWRAEGDDPVSR